MQDLICGKLYTMQHRAVFQDHTWTLGWSVVFSILVANLDGEQQFVKHDPKNPVFVVETGDEWATVIHQKGMLRVYMADFVFREFRDQDGHS